MSFENDEQKRLALVSRRAAGADGMLQAFLPDVLVLVNRHNVEHDGKDSFGSKTFRKNLPRASILVLTVTVTALVGYAVSVLFH